MMKTLARSMMHHYPFIRGRSRFTTQLSQLFPLAPGTVVSFDGDLQLELCEKQFVSRQIFWFGIFEPREAHFFKQMIAPGMTVIDVGGNIGQYTLLAAKRVGPRGQVHTFEPAAENHAILQRNIQRNGFSDRVVLNKLAVGAERKQEKLILTPDGGSNWVSTSGANPGEGDASEVIACETLDDYLAEKGLAKVDFMKIDAEGSDLNVLKGAVKTLETHHPTLFVEFANRVLVKYGASSEAMLQFLLQLGYTPLMLTRHGLEPLHQPVDLSRDMNLFFQYP